MLCVIFVHYSCVYHLGNDCVNELGHNYSLMLDLIKPITLTLTWKYNALNTCITIIQYEMFNLLDYSIKTTKNTKLSWGRSGIVGSL